MLFWSGNAYFSGCAMVSSSVTFLMLERIRALIWPTKNCRYFFGLSAFVSVICVGLFVSVSLAVIETPVDEKTGKFFYSLEYSMSKLLACVSFGCIVAKQKKGITCFATKSILGLINFLIAIIFAYLFYKHRSTSNANQRQFRQVS